MNNIQHNSTLLNDLIQINHERIGNYTTALDALKDGNHELNFILAKMLTQSHRFISELTAQTEAFAENEPITNAGNGAVYELWTNLKEQLPNGRSHTIFNSCKGDLLAVFKTYDKVSDYSGLHPSIKEIADRHKDELKVFLAEISETLNAGHS